MPAKPLTLSQLEDAERIRTLFRRWQEKRADAGLPKSQEAAAGELGFGQSALSQYMRGKIPLNPDTLVKLSRLFGVRPDEVSPDLTRELHEKGFLTVAVGGLSANNPERREVIPPQFEGLSTSHEGDTYNSPMTTETSNVPVPLQYSVDNRNVRRVFVVGHAPGGMPERLWTDGDCPVGATNQYAELATVDPHAFLSPINDTSMSPRYNPGEFALIEPATEPELEDDVLVRLTTGTTMLKRLVSRRGGIQLASYNEPGTMLLKETEISWMYYVAHPVPARKIRQRM